VNGKQTSKTLLRLKKKKKFSQRITSKYTRPLSKTFNANTIILLPIISHAESRYINAET
jgi:hypothetical protein